MTKHQLTETDIEEMRRWKLAGFSHADIGLVFAVGPTTVRKHCRDVGSWKPQRALEYSVRLVLKESYAVGGYGWRPSQAGIVGVVSRTAVLDPDEPQG